MVAVLQIGGVLVLVWQSVGMARGGSADESAMRHCSACSRLVVSVLVLVWRSVSIARGGSADVVAVLQTSGVLLLVWLSVGTARVGGAGELAMRHCNACSRLVVSWCSCGGQLALRAVAVLQIGGVVVSADVVQCYCGGSAVCTVYGSGRRLRILCG